MLIEAYFIFIQQIFYISTWAHNCLIYMHTHTFIYSHNSQWAQSILPFPYCTTLIKCVCIRSYNKPFTKPQARLTNFLALTEIVSHSNWLIFPCVIKPGYLPEQPRSHGPDDRSSTCCCGQSHPCWVAEQGTTRSGFLHSEHGWREPRTQEKREETEAYRKPNTRRDVVESQSRSVRRTALTYSLAPMLTNEQLGRQD